jgi:hypothetical protein
MGGQQAAAQQAAAAAGVTDPGLRTPSPHQQQRATGGRRGSRSHNHRHPQGSEAAAATGSGATAGSGASAGGGSSKAARLLSQCHVRAAQGQALHMSRQEVQELVQLQLQTATPVRAPWYRQQQRSLHRSAGGSHACGGWGGVGAQEGAAACELGGGSGGGSGTGSAAAALPARPAGTGVFIPLACRRV